MRRICGRGVLALLMWTIFCPGQFVFAESAGLVVSPPFQEVSIGAEDSRKTVEFLITNRSSVEQALEPVVVDFKSLDESGGVAFVGLRGEQFLRRYGLANWLVLPQTVITLPPGGSTKVSAQVDNRTDLAPGGHYGAVVFRVRTDLSPQPGTKLNIQQVFASLIFVKKTDGATYGLHLSNVSLPRNWRVAAPILRLRFNNTGNVHAVPRGTVELIDARGKLTAKGLVNAESAIILPETARHYDVPLKPIYPIGAGKYTLKVSYRYDGTQKLLVYNRAISVHGGGLGAVVSFGVAGILLAFAFGIFYYLHRRSNTK